MNEFKFILKKIWKHLFGYLIGTILQIAFIIVNLEMIKLVGNTIDLFNEGNNQLLVLHNAKIVIILAVSYACLRMLWRPIIISMAKKIKKELIEEFYKKLYKFPINFYTDKTSGTIINYLQNDIDLIEKLLSEKYILLINNVFVTLITVIYMFKYINIKITLMAVIVISISYIIAIMLSKNMYSKYEDARRTKRKNTSKLTEILSNIKTIKIFNKKEEYIDNYREAEEKLKSKEIKIAKKKDKVTLYLNLYTNISYAFILMYISIFIKENTFTIGSFVEFMTYFSLITVRNLNYSTLFSEYKKAKVSIRKIIQILNIPVKGKKLPYKKLEGKTLEVKNLTVNPYEDNTVKENILKNVSFKLQKGEILGVIGKTGSGKSTLVNILAELYSVPENVIKVDDIDINEMAPRSIQDTIDIITQDNFIFKGSIYENIMFYKDKYTKDEVKEACKKALIHNQIMKMDDKYETLLSENGANLSIGQKQKIRIARSFLSMKKIIIFDECFAGLDSKTSIKIIENIRKYLNDKIVIIVSNNINNIRLCDKIIVMEDGKIIEKGTEKELIDKKKEYYKMYEYQKYIVGDIYDN